MYYNAKHVSDINIVSLSLFLHLQWFSCLDRMRIKFWSCSAFSCNASLWHGGHFLTWLPCIVTIAVLIFYHYLVLCAYWDQLSFFLLVILVEKFPSLFLFLVNMMSQSTGCFAFDKPRVIHESCLMIHDKLDESNLTFHLYDCTYQVLCNSSAPWMYIFLMLSWVIDFSVLFCYHIMFFFVSRYTFHVALVNSRCKEF